MNIVFYGQNKGSILVVDTIVNTTGIKGDSFSVKVKNLTPSDRGFIIEVVALVDEPYYYNAVYSAYLNNDISFFKKLRAAEKGSKKNTIPYVLPNYRAIFYDIKGNSERTINFMIKGKSIKNGVMTNLRITSDLVKDEFETIYSNPFKMHVLPN